jgi:hypothetical protein
VDLNLAVQSSCHRAAVPSPEEKEKPQSLVEATKFPLRARWSPAAVEGRREEDHLEARMAGSTDRREGKGWVA